jgi:hypothetical protein
MKKLLALVISIVTLGAFAAPTSAEPRQIHAFQSCVFIDSEGDVDVLQREALRPAGVEAQQFAIAGFNRGLKNRDAKCVPGTRQITIEPA